MSVQIRYVTVDELPHGAPCAIVGEPDALVYMLCRTASVEDLAAGLERLYAKLAAVVDYLVEEQEKSA